MMDKCARKISVVTVCYNAAESIEATMLSVLNQTYPEVEYIVIDGGSTDGTVEIIKRYADRLACWVSERDRGTYDGMNKGIARATGDFINFMNAGDTFSTPTVLEEFVPAIEEDTTVAFGDWNSVIEGKLLKRTPYSMSRMKLMTPFCHQAGFVKTDYHKANPFDISFKIAADYNMLYNAYNRDGRKFQYIPVTVANYENYNGLSSTNPKRLMEENFRIWGIADKPLKQLPYRLVVLKAKIFGMIKRHLPTGFVVKVKSKLDARRRHFE